MDQKLTDALNEISTSLVDAVELLQKKAAQGGDAVALTKAIVGAINSLALNVKVNPTPITVQPSVVQVLDRPDGDIELTFDYDRHDRISTVRITRKRK